MQTSVQATTSAQFAMRWFGPALLAGMLAAGCGISASGTAPIPSSPDSSTEGRDSSISPSADGGAGAVDSTTGSSGDGGATGAADSAATDEDGSDASAVGATADAGLDATSDVGVDGMPDESGVAVTPDAAGDAAGEGVVDSGAVCAAPATRCVGNSVETCAPSGRWGAAMDCGEQTCVSGECAGECAPGEMQCDGPLQPQSCGPSGAWQDSGSPCTVACTGAGVCTAPMCLSSDGGEAQCAHGDNCCSQGMGKATAGSCAATCTAPAYALDCTGNTGTNECGAGTVCCATLVIDGGVVGDCTIAELSSSCQASCADDLPGTTCGSPEDPLTFTLRLCTATADCASDDSRTSCCAYEDSPIYWCVSDRALTTDCKP